MNLRQFLLDNAGSSMADYLLDLAMSGYSMQTMRHLLYRNFNQEWWHANYGVDEYREMHADNADLIEEAIFVLAGAKVLVAA